MSAIARLWVKWILDDTKPHSIDMVPEHWREEVERLIDEEKAKNKEDSKG